MEQVGTIYWSVTFGAKKLMQSVSPEKPLIQIDRLSTLGRLPTHCKLNTDVMQSVRMTASANQTARMMSRECDNETSMEKTCSFGHGRAQKHTNRQVMESRSRKKQGRAQLQKWIHRLGCT